MGNLKIPLQFRLLSQQEKDELVEKLLACPTMKERSSRNRVVLELPFTDSISRNPDATNKDDVMDIVNRCLNFSNGLQQLIERIEYREENSLPMQELITFLNILLSLPDFNSGSRLNIKDTARPALSWKPPLQRPRRSEYFVDREHEQVWILENLIPGRIVTICGSGGMGKTALVAEVLWRLAPGDSPPDRFPDGIIFHSFYRQPEVIIAMEQIARTFGEKLRPTPALAAQRALNRRHALLVFDGAEEADNLRQILEVCAENTVLVTSRSRADAVDLQYLQILNPLPKVQAVAVIQAWGGKQATDESIIYEISQVVGNLPLALRMAGRYLALNEEEASEYLRLLQEAPLAFLDQGRSQQDSVLVLLMRSMMKLNEEAQRVLGIIGLLAPTAFDRVMMERILNLSKARARKALDELYKYGLLLYQEQHYEVSHALIHTYAREYLIKAYKRAEQRDLVIRIIQVLNDWFPVVADTNLAMCERALPHVQVCLTLIDRYEIATGEAAQLLNKAGNYLYEHVRYAEAELLLQRGLEINEQAHGSIHPDTVRSLNSLAWLYQRRGKYEQAEPLLQRALAIREQVLGPAHPDTAQSLSGLAGLYESQGKYDQATTLYQRALAIYEQVLGSEHPNTTTVQKNYASLLLRIFQIRSTSPIKELTEAAKTLKGWQEQCLIRGTILRENDIHDLRSARLLALANLLEKCYTSIIVARDDIIALTQQSFSSQDALAQALRLFASHLKHIEQKIKSNVELIKLLGADWPLKQQEIIECITDFLLYVPLQMKGENSVIDQARNDVEERVNFTWESAFNLSAWLEKWRTKSLTDNAKAKLSEKDLPLFQKLIQFFVDLGNGAEALALSEHVRAFMDLLAQRGSNEIVAEHIEVPYLQATVNQPFTLEEIVQIVRERRSFTIEYFFTETKLVIWTITSAGDITIFVSPASRSDLELLVKKLAHLVQIPEYSDQKSVQLFEILQQLYLALIAPAADQLAALSKEEVITIIPHDQLFLVPFCALRDEQGVYLIEKHALVYSPAIVTLKYTQLNAEHVIHRDNPNMLALVNPLESLISSEQDFDALVRFYKTAQKNVIYRRQQASKEILENEASNYTVLCFVTHTQAFDENPMDSYLALAATDFDNGRLEVPAILQLELHADLVILGAGETEQTKITGYGVNELSRAFISAGASSLLMSLWAVGEDESMNQLYTFHEFWRGASISKAEALRQAQLEALANHPLQPEVWAAFSLIGEWI